MPVSPRLLPLSAALLAASSLSACSFFEELFGNPADALDVRVPVSFEIPQDLPIIFPSPDVISGLPTLSDGSREFEVPPIFVNDLNLAELDPTGQLDTASAVIKRVEITEVTVTVRDNSLHTEIQPIELRVGTPSSNYDGALEAATTPVLPVGFEGTEDGVINEGNREDVGAIIADFRFGVGLGTTIVIPPGEIPEAGQATARLRMELTVVISPL